MSADIQIKLVPVEFLRPGPPHNQLLSPLTQYLAISGDAGSGVITVPYEHAAFERRLRDLRYETGDAGDRQAMLHETGVEMGKILGAVPGLSGALSTDSRQPGALIQLRLTLSASELALLPFEIAKVPISASSTGENWLSIHTRPPVCITRNIRTVSPEGVIWPERPRVLFIAGDNVPSVEHRDVLLNAIQPFRYPGADDPVQSEGGSREQFGDLLTILANPTLADVFRECQGTPYTHVHILTHGDLSDTSRDAYGLVLRGTDGATEVVSGEQFASALTSIGDGVIHRPTVVTVASCDSGNVGTVIMPGASFAHAIHQAGIPLVVASQFPLSKEGSVPMAATLYGGLLWGEHPLVLLQRLRAELHTRYTSMWHDWASLVVYEALPQALADQLERVRYFQTKRAINAALERIDLTVESAPHSVPEGALADLDLAVERALERLSLHGPYSVECVGLRASARKRLAQAAFTLATQASGNASGWHDPIAVLDQARGDYERAARGLLVNDARAVQRMATLHWVLVQAASLGVVLGRPLDRGQWEAARLCAEMYCDHEFIEERAFANGDLAELWLLRLAEPDVTDAERTRFAAQAVHHAESLGRMYPWNDDFPVRSTRRQFTRYVEWWGTPQFTGALQERGTTRPRAWDAKPGVIETARQIVALLQRRSAPPRSTPPVAAKAKKKATRTPSAVAGTPKASSPRPVPVADRGGAGGFLTIEMLPAGHGDSLWIEYGDSRRTHRWLNDCGTQRTAKELLQRVAALPDRERWLELFVMTHIDSDHIGGALPFFQAVKRGLKFGDVWFNGWRHLSGQLGARQGEMFSTAIQDFELPWNGWRDGGAIVVDAALPTCTLPGGMVLTLLSPTPAELRRLAPVWTRELKRYGLEPGSRVDYSRFLKGTPSTSTDVDELADTPFGGDAGAPNGTSIALLAEYGGASVLLGADAHAPVLVSSLQALLKQRGLERLPLHAFKVPHHASQNNVSIELIQLLDCSKFLISTNGDHFSHPDRQAIARILKYGGAGVELYFNYRTTCNEVWERPDLQEQYGYRTHYPDQRQPGAIVSLETSAC